MVGPGDAAADAQTPALAPVQFRPIEPLPQPLPEPFRPQPLPAPIQPESLPQPIVPNGPPPNVDLRPAHDDSQPNNPPPADADLDGVADRVFDQDIASLPIVVKARGATG
jgi:hypothetical protein